MLLAVATEIRKFPIELGDDQRFSRILEREEVPYARGKIVWIPDALRFDFERDVEGALRDWGYVRGAKNDCR